MSASAAGAGPGTALDYTIADKPGYFAGSVWPVECGGNRRQKLVSSRGLCIQQHETLRSITRPTGGWAVMFIQRGEGELYLQCGPALGPGEVPPERHPPPEDSTGWLERVDSITLETLARSPPLPSGGHIWCGAAVAHANGDLYAVSGRYVHRLGPGCDLVASCRLPFDGPYNGLMVMCDGNMILKNLGHDPTEPCVFSVLAPDLTPVSEPFVIESACMGRFSSDWTPHGEFVYTTTATHIIRLRYADGVLRLDPSWTASYRLPGEAGEGQSDGWDTTIGSGSIWMMDKGRPPFWRGLSQGPQRAFRVSLDDPTSRDVVDEIKIPAAFNPGPPLYDPMRRILVHYDTLGKTVVAHRYRSPGEIELLWKRRMRNSVQMMLYADTGELVLEDSPRTMSLDDNEKSGAIAVVDIATGKEHGRAGIGSRGTMGMFCCPGWSRDFYVCAVNGTIARVFVDDSAVAKL